ncbi:uncharacterized protein MYCFIDRAFT_182445 [Pseudocercospora fijiensis CIRAD86]|uniref:Uncharacterized protein n=1 Tax=Pseudocercospora fijiensis (strain CIRAD86) TaxID=383855 RepID=M2Z4Q5_PSEFD|nr:uncharacterized protein MYCFIDRAFT_182445 [Pseudocercospora fijiensis CIRAD86]EME84770.1 hypothetical protein MYCFIDRAFT_182445 [Pseudocercospora fijiensis CIRAD86]
MAADGKAQAGRQHNVCHFFRLPAELRAEIYRLVLIRECFCRLSFGGQQPQPSEQKTQLTDFLVCKKWLSEAYSEYLKHNVFEFNSIEDLKQFIRGHEITRSTVRAVYFSCFWDAYWKMGVRLGRGTSRCLRHPEADRWSVRGFAQHRNYRPLPWNIRSGEEDVLSERKARAKQL